MFKIFVLENHKLVVIYKNTIIIAFHIRRDFKNAF